MKRLNVRLIVILLAVVLVSGIGVYFLHRWQTDSHARGLLRRADLAEEAGELPKAIGFLGRYMQQRPDDGEVLTRMALLQEKTTQERSLQPREFQATGMLLENAIRQSPDDAELRQRTAEFYLRSGRSKDAIEHLQALPPGDRDADAQMLLARAFARSGNFEEAISLLEEIVGYSQTDNEFDAERALDAHQVPAYVSLAHIYVEQLGKTTLADRTMEACVAANRDSAEAYLARGEHFIRRALKESGQARDDLFANGESDIRHAAQLSPGDAEVIGALADVEIRKGDLESAKVWLARGMESFPQREIFFRARAGIALKEKQTAEALTVIQEGLRASPDSWPLLLMQAEVDLASGNLDRMRKTAGRLRADERLEVLGDYLDAQALLRERNWQACSAAFEELLPELMARRPDLGPNAYAALAQCYEQLGQTDQQREANRQLIELEPASLAGRFSEARALVRLGRMPEAQRELALAKRIAAQQGVEMPELEKWEITILAANRKNEPETADPISNTVAADEIESRFLQQVNSRDDLSDEQKAAIHVRYLLQQGDLPKATRRLEAALEHSPDSDVLRLAEVDLVQRRDGSHAAAQLLAELAESHENGVEIRLRQALFLAEQPDEKTASQLKQLEDDTQDFTAADQERLWYGLGVIHHRLGDAQETMRLWRSIAEANPAQLPIRLQLFELAMAERDDELMSQIADETRQIAGDDSAQAKFVEAHRRLFQSRLAAATGESANQSLAPAAIQEIRDLVHEAQAKRPSWHALSLLHADLDLLEGNVRGAIENLQRAIEQGPVSIPAVRKLVELLWSQQRFEDARDVMAQLGPQAESDVLGARAQSRLELAEGDLAGAITLARKSAQDLNRLSDHLWLGQLLARDNQWEQAIEAYRQAVAIAPADEQARLLLLRALLTSGKREAAEAEVRNIALYADPQQVDRVLGIAHQMLGQSLLAKRHFEQAVLAQPNSAQARRDLAAFFLLARDPALAMQHIDHLLAMDTAQDVQAADHIAWARRAKARLIGLSGRYSDYRQAVELLTKNASEEALTSEDLLLLAELTLPRDDPYALQQAIARFEQASTTRPLSPRERMTWAKLNLALGQWSECEGIMTSLIGEHPNDQAVIAAWCDMKLKHGDTRNVQTLLRQLPLEAPNTKRLHARLLAQTGESDRAWEVLKDLSPPLHDAQRLPDILMFAAFLEELELNDQAERLLRSAAVHFPRLRLELAGLLSRTGKLNEAFGICQAELSSNNIVAVSRIGIMGLTESRGRISPESPEYQRVENWITQGLRELPDSKRMLLHHAYLNELQGEHELAMELYLQYLSRSDLTFAERAIAANNLAMLEAGMNRYGEARAHIDQAIELLGTNAAMLDTRAMVRLCHGQDDDVERAIGELRLALSVTQEPVIQFHLAVALHASGDRNAARETMEEAQANGLVRQELSVLDRVRYDRLIASLKSDATSLNYDGAQHVQFVPTPSSGIRTP